jgi:DNA invertase Pin-like site-specific DNA recombinase
VKLLSAVEGDVENVDSDPTRKLMRGILGQIADYERAMITLKLRAARQRARTNTGRCEGRKPFGDRPGEQEIADRMKSMRDSGMPL